MVERARLESWYRGNSIEGSNPFLSAKDQKASASRWPFIFRHIPFLELQC